MHQSAMESPGSNSEQGSSARVIQETPNSHSDQSSVSYKDWKRPDRSVQSSSLPRGVSTVRCKMALKLCYRTPGRLVTSREKHLLLLSTPAGAIHFSTPAQSLSALPGTATNSWQTPPMPSAECFDETPPQSDMPANWQSAHEEIGIFTPIGMVCL